MLLGVAAVCAAVLSLAAAFLYLDPQIPKPETYRNVQLETPLRILTADGQLMAEFGERRVIPMTLDEVPQDFINALLDTEDKRFYEHSGIDFISLTNDVASLAGSLLTDGEVGAGASTITMQLARNVSFSLERRFLRKFKEMLLALKIEQELEKDEILELYLNVVAFGKRAYGAQAAAMTYYGKPLEELDLAQLAMLAGIPQAPSAANPINGPERAIARRNLVLTRMFAQGSIDQTQYQLATQAPITASVYSRNLDVASPYAAEWVRQQGAALLDDLYTGGYEIITTIDSAMQAAAIAAVRKGLLEYDRKHGFRGVEGTADETLRDQLLALTEEQKQPWRTPVPDSDTDSSLEQEGAVSVQETSPSPLFEPDMLAGLTDAIRDLEVSGGLEPAVVLDVTDTDAVVFSRAAQTVVLQLEDTTWARQYIDTDVQGAVPESMRDVIAVGDLVRIRPVEEGWHLAQLPAVQGALVSLNPQDGAVRAMVGGFDFFANQYNHALQAARQPGSGFKPFLYATAINTEVTPASIFMDAPLVFEDANLESQYRPKNDNQSYNGPTRLREALYRSINLVSIRVLLEIGAGTVLDYVPNFGFATNTFPRNTQLAIGGGTMAVTPIDMSRAYAVFANGGYLVDPYIVSEIRTNQGDTVYRANPAVVPNEAEQLALDTLAEQLETDEDVFEEPTDLAAVLADNPVPEDTTLDELAPAAADNSSTELSDIESEDDSNLDTANEDLLPEPVFAPRVIDARTAYIMDSMLRDVIKRGTGRRALALGRTDLAGKTGTTNDATDTWFNGYSPHLTTSVWVGFSNFDPLGATAYGSNTPLPIWVDYMQTALADLPPAELPQPAGLVTVKIDPQTGEVAEPGSATAIFEIFKSESAPKTRASSGRPAPEEEEINALDLF